MFMNTHNSSQSFFNLPVSLISFILKTGIFAHFSLHPCAQKAFSKKFSFQYKVSSSTQILIPPSKKLIKTTKWSCYTVLKKEELQRERPLRHWPTIANLLWPLDCTVSESIHMHTQAGTHVQMHTWNTHTHEGFSNVRLIWHATFSF